jgi:hypothetical protein
MRRLISCVLTILSLFIPAAAVAGPDSGRDNTTPTTWSVYHGVTQAQIAATVAAAVGKDYVAARKDVAPPLAAAVSKR